LETFLMRTAGISFSLTGRGRKLLAFVILSAAHGFFGGMRLRMTQRATLNLVRFG